jgi:hypothetical protein
MVRQARSRLQRIDHVTFVVSPATIRQWAWFYIEVCGGTLTLRVDDTNPDEASSMMLWTIDFGEFGIALVAGIDREAKSHVTAFWEKHGDHSVQHIAVDVGDLGGFLDLTGRYGLRPIGEIQERDDDGFGPLKQVFAPGYHRDDNPARTGFYEFVERPQKAGLEAGRVTFSGQTGTNLYRQAQEAMEHDRRASMVDFALMPDAWEPPAPSKDRPS